MEEKHLHTNKIHDDEIDLSQILRILSQYRYWMMATALVIIFAASLYAFLSTPIYRSEDRKSVV